MNRPIALAGLLAFSAWAMSGLAFAQLPAPCSLISEKEASTLVGGPADQVARGAAKQVIAKLP